MLSIRIGGHITLGSCLQVCWPLPHDIAARHQLDYCSRMTEEEQEYPSVTGRVKWFDPVKGFGFIVSDEAGGDILLHANVLRNYGQSSIADGTAITVRVQRTARGIQATEVVEVMAPETPQLALSEEDQSSLPEEMTSLPLEPARMKWFDKDKGFGFANVFGRPEDVFVHVEVLRASGFADLQAGEAVCLRIIEGKRGRMAVQVVSWESAVRR
jgi:CspA family cold shock protein